MTRNRVEYMYSKWIVVASAAFVLAVCSVGCSPAIGDGKTFYIDSAGGADSAGGRSAETAWRSLGRVNANVFTPGDRIRFKAGSRFSGQLHPQGSGSEKAPIIVDSYGEGEKPLIEAEGQFREALLLENQDYWEINNLQLTNTGPTRETFRYGVRVKSWDYGTMRHINLKNLDVHDVNGSLVKKDAGEGHGIVWENGGDEVPSRFDGLLIEGCHLVRTDRNGICGHTYYPNGRGEKWFPSLNVVIRRNLLEDIGGDAIKVWGCDGALVEHNVVRGARERCDDYAAGIWPWNSDNTLIQYNEVSGVKGYKDGQSFDSDGFCANTVFQYNYSYDNDGGFMLICGRENTGTVIRYNISQNDRSRLFHIAGLPEDIEIYNNVFYTGKGIDLHLFLWTGGGENWPRDITVLNNIFYSDGVGRNSSGMKRRREPVYDGTYISRPGFGGAKDVKFENNILHGKFTDIPREWRAMMRDPMLEEPGRGSEGFDSLDGYRLRDGSPAAGAGKRVEHNGGRDFWDNKLPDGKPSIGVHEKAAQ